MKTIEYEIRIGGCGTRADIAKALQLIAAQLLAPLDPEEIEGGQFNDNTCEVLDLKEISQ